MAQTKAQIRNRVLRKLGKLAHGQNAESAIAEDIEDAYDQVYAKLKKRGMATWLSASVPDEFVEDVVAITAFERAEGISGERYARVAGDAQRAFLNLSALISGKWTNPRKAENF